VGLRSLVYSLFSSGYSLQDVTAPTMSIAVTQYIGTSKVNPSDIDEVSLDSDVVVDVDDRGSSYSNN